MRGTRVTWQPSFEGATAELEEPRHGSAAALRSLWWQWTAPRPGVLRVSKAGSPAGTVLELYRGSSLGGLIPIGIPEGGTVAGSQETLRYEAKEGERVYIALDAKDPAIRQARASLTFAVPVHDEFSGRLKLGGLPVAVEADNVDATFGLGPGPSDPTLGGRSVWWEWSAVEAGHVAVSTLGSDFDTELSVMKSGGAGEFVVLDTNDDHEGASSSQVSFRADPGQVYYLCVDGIRGDSGLIRLSIQSAEPPANDSFSNRILLTGPVVAVQATNQFATVEPGDPDAGTLGFDTAASSTMWWTWTPTREGRVRMTTAGSTFDTRLAVLEGAALGNLKLVQANDNDARTGDRTSRVEFQASAGTTYQILVESGPYDRRGVLKLQLRLSLPSRILPDTVRVTADMLEFEAEGLPATNYQAETSPDLRVWSAFSMEPLSGPRLVFRERVRPGGPVFYRIVEVP
ncbi:MAG: hypothetical protein FJ404_15315 [Verrucomicrobia bacterium]|nr:hypothetical protein [Verrucomicrobiota bacterium]